MRVLCSSDLDNNIVEGEVIAGQDFDEELGGYDLTGKFTVRCDDGEIFHVSGWMVDVTVLDGDNRAGEEEES